MMEMIQLKGNKLENLGLRFKLAGKKSLGWLFTDSPAEEEIVKNLLGRRRLERAIQLEGKRKRSRERYQTGTVKNYFLHAA